MITEKLQTEFAKKIANAVIFRINYPKVKAGKMTRHASLNAKVRPLLSFHDEQEVKQTVSLVLCSTPPAIKYRDKGGNHYEKKVGRAMDDCKMSFAHWKIIFREVRGLLNIDRNSKRGQADTANPIDLMTEAEADFLTTQTRKPFHLARRLAIARKVRYLRAQVFAGFAADTKRNRNANLKKHLAISRFLASQYSVNAQGFAEILESAESESALRMAMMRFREYTQKGETFMTASALEGVKARKIEFKSFADLFAVCD